MTLPREIAPGRFYLITRRCTQRQFLLRPDAETNNAFTYCLAEAAQRHRMEILLPVAMSNHYHVVVYDRFGTAPAFTEQFHKMLAKCLNARRGRWENVWSTEQVSMVRLVNAEDVMRKLVYTALNPVEAHLVEKVHHWPGVNGLSALLQQQSLEAYRPRHFFRPDGPMPKTVSLPLVIPPELGDRDLVLAELRATVLAKESAISDERRRGGVGVLGRRAVKQQSWRDSPASREPRRTVNPTIAARSSWSRIEAILRNRHFVVAYRAARATWLLGETISFPAGTYWLSRFANVPIED